MPNAYSDLSSTITVEFDDGVIFTLRQYMDAGMQEDLEAELVAIKVQQQANGINPSSKQAFDARIRSGDLYRIELMTLEIKRADGHIQRQPTIPKSAFRGLSRQAMVVLSDKIEEFNPPLATLRDQLHQETIPEP